MLKGTWNFFIFFLKNFSYMQKKKRVKKHYLITRPSFHIQKNLYFLHRSSDNTWFSFWMRLEKLWMEKNNCFLGEIKRYHFLNIFCFYIWCGDPDFFFSCQKRRMSSIIFLEEVLYILLSICLRIFIYHTCGKKNIFFKCFYLLIYCELMIFNKE